ncbi:hypothetical protein F2Q70_00027640 [Brassica cretica]|uniref:Uncharacterized protein n=2 Tax=Brassica cretica TaxID=69181 RepID=A0A8S9L3R5_BRACR|nr:hypothetical protein F2Q68_00027194 [Brassica cretica]KAF2602700.1 hypothetical protein F2Q70_00027640 [Brassica cretica]KAF3575426.1 hypothetical protein DY000_02034056 [Brassica cretica]
MDLKDYSHANVKYEEELHDTSAVSSEKMPLEPDPRWPYLKKWSVTASPSPQLPRSAPPLLKSKTPEPEEDVPQPLMNSSCSPESGEEIITSSKEMVSLIHNHSQVTVQDPKNAREGMIDPQQMLQPDSSLSPTTSSPSPSLGAWTIPLKMYEPSPFIKAASQEYPWAAKMKSVCNLNRVTVPEYLEDGTPKVTVPSHVILQGIQNQKEYVVGQFYRCSAPAGATINNPIDKITIVEDELRMEAKQDTTFSLKEKVEQSSPNTNSEHLSTHSITCNTTSNSHTPLGSSKETPYSSNHVSTNSTPADCSIRMSLSSSNLLTNRFSSLKFSDDEDETLISSDELDPKEYLSPQDKVFLRERPVKPSTKAKEMQLHSVARGRGNRNRGNRGRNRGGRG